MRPRLMFLALLLCLVLSQTAFARSPRVKHATSTPALPPFPWVAILETVGPMVAIWVAAFVIRGMMVKENQGQPIGPAEVVSLPAAWFAAISSIVFSFRNSQPAGPLQPNLTPDTHVLTPDS